MFEALEEAAVTIMCPRTASGGAGGSGAKNRLGPGIGPEDENKWFKATLEKVRYDRRRDRRDVVVSVRGAAAMVTAAPGDGHSV